ncbi:MAG: hypothetical protein HY360_00665 [Verrucomicrobia bacterium]|nr:hypothetical protein [Verrucomicrobiota bacterium]
MKIPKGRRRAVGQAMLETMVMAAILVSILLTFGAVVSAFLDHGYRTIRLISMEYP